MPIQYVFTIKVIYTISEIVNKIAQHSESPYIWTEPFFFPKNK